MKTTIVIDHEDKTVTVSADGSADTHYTLISMSRENGIAEDYPDGDVIRYKLDGSAVFTISVQGARP